MDRDPNTSPASTSRSSVRRVLPFVASLLLLAIQSCRHDDNIYDQVDANLSLIQADAENIVVRVTLANHGTSIRIIPAWDLPPSGQLSRALFDVARNGVRMQYYGHMSEPAVPLREFIAIEPGKQLAVTIALAQGYDVGPRGEYKISYHTTWPSRRWLSGTNLFDLKSNVLVVKK